MQVNLKKEQKFLRMGRVLKNNLKKRKVFLDKIKKKVKNNK